MSLKATIAAGVKTALAAVGDVRKTIVFTEVSVGAYDPEADALTTTEVDTTISVPWVRPAKAEMEFYPAVNRDVAKIIIEAASLSGEPSLEDYVTDETGARWEIVRTTRDPSDSVYVLFLQAT